jgi:hypothetical protein
MLVVIALQHDTQLDNSNDWITAGIKTSCKHKRELYITCKNTKNIDLNNKYCKILSKVIKEAKKLKYDNQIKNYKNKNKTIWDIVKQETNKPLLTRSVNTQLALCGV